MGYRRRFKKKLMKAFAIGTKEEVPLKGKKKGLKLVSHINDFKLKITR